MKLKLTSIYTILLLSLMGCGGGSSSSSEESNTTSTDSNSNNSDSSTTDDGIRLIKTSTYKTAEKKVLLYTLERKYDKNLRLINEKTNILATQTKINTEFKYKNNLIIEILVKPDENSSLTTAPVHSSAKYNYDNKGKLVEVLTYNLKTELLLNKRFGFEWDNDGKAINWKYTRYGNDANILETSTHVVSYDNKNVTRETVNRFLPNGTLFLTNIFDYEYDDKRAIDYEAIYCSISVSAQEGCSANNILKMTQTSESTSIMVIDYTYDLVYKENGLPLNRSTTAEVSTELPDPTNLNSIIEDSVKQYEEYEYNKD